MKLKHFLSILTVVGFIFIGCKNAEADSNSSASTQSDSEMPEMLATASFTIEGMHCEHGCAGNIKKKLAKMQGVKEVEIDFEGKKATIVYDANKQSPEAFVEKVLSIDKTYVVSDVTNTTDKAFLSNGGKDKKKNSKKTNETLKSSNTDEVPAKSCGSEKKSGCCSKKTATI